MGAVGGRGARSPLPPPPGTPRHGEPAVDGASRDGLTVPAPGHGSPWPAPSPPGQAVSLMPCRVPGPGLLLWGQGPPVWALVMGRWALRPAQQPSSWIPLQSGASGGQDRVPASGLEEWGEGGEPTEQAEVCGGLNDQGAPVLRTPGSGSHGRLWSRGGPASLQLDMAASSPGLPRTGCAAKRAARAPLGPGFPPLGRGWHWCWPRGVQGGGEGVSDCRARL